MVCTTTARYPRGRPLPWSPWCALQLPVSPGGACCPWPPWYALQVPISPGGACCPWPPWCACKCPLAPRVPVARGPHGMHCKCPLASRAHVAHGSHSRTAKLRRAGLCSSPDTIVKYPPEIILKFSRVGRRETVCSMDNLESDSFTGGICPAGSICWWYRFKFNADENYGK